MCVCVCASFSELEKYRWNYLSNIKKNHYYNIYKWYNAFSGLKCCRGRDRMMVVGFTITYANNAYHH